MTDEVYETLRAAVRLARDEQIRTVRQLRARLLTHGHTPENISSALIAWSSHVRR